MKIGQLKKVTLYILGMICSIAFCGIIIMQSSNKGLFLIISIFFMLSVTYLLWAVINGQLQDIKTSKIVCYIKNHFWLIVLLLLASAIVTFISYPGIWYSDSYTRVEMAFSMEEMIVNALTSSGGEYFNPLSPMSSFVMYLCLLVTNNIAFYTMMQAFFLIFGITVFIDCTTHKNSQKLIGYVLFLTSPIVFCTATYYEAGVGCFSGMTFLIAALMQNDLHNSLDRFLQWLIIAFSCVIIFGYRINAFTIIPIIVIATFVFYKANKKGSFK